MGKARRFRARALIGCVIALLTLAALPSAQADPGKISGTIEIFCAITTPPGTYCGAHGPYAGQAWGHLTTSQGDQVKFDILNVGVPKVAGLTNGEASNLTIGFDQEYFGFGQGAFPWPAGGVAKGQLTACGWLIDETGSGCIHARFSYTFAATYGSNSIISASGLVGSDFDQSEVYMDISTSSGGHRIECDVVHSGDLSQFDGAWSMTPWELNASPVPTTLYLHGPLTFTC